MGAELACAPGKENKLGVALLAEVNIQRLETAIDHAESELTPLKNFILPGGSPGAAALHHARTVCRRAERCFWLATRQEPLRPELGRYLNRLSDLLFVLARSANRHSGVPDETWTPRQG
jgi:cob(I)alamin adenosyltransferase